MKKEIRELVALAFDAHPQYFVMEIGSISSKQAEILNIYVKENLNGLKRIMDTNAIRHTIKEHGNFKTETLRGQLPVNTDDFLLVPYILTNPDKTEYMGKNSLKHDVFRYTKNIDVTYFVAESVRFSKKKGNKMVFQTMYKRKTN